jgi:hypothetical protein
MRKLTSLFKMFRPKKTNLKTTPNLVLEKRQEITFAPHFEKTITEEQKQVFWKKYFSQESRQFIEKRKDAKKPVYISNYNKKMLIFKVTPTVLATVRKFKIDKFKIYQEALNNLKQRQKVISSQLKNLDIKIVENISMYQKGKYVYVLERIFPSISVTDLVKAVNNNYTLKQQKQINRFLPSFLKKLSENNISKKDFLKEVMSNIGKLHHFLGYADIAPNNVIILGYDFKNKILKIGLIDIFGKNSTSL